MSFDAEKIRDEIVQWIRDWFEENGKGCKAVVGLSGGKDSLTLALALKGLQRFYPKHFELQAFTISLGFHGTDFSPVADFMAAHDIPYQVIESDIGEIVFEQRKEKNKEVRDRNGG